MKYYNRRKEIGKMLVDVVKYIITIVIIGSLLTEKLTAEMALLGTMASLGFLIVAFFVIPPDKERELRCIHSM